MSHEASCRYSSTVIIEPKSWPGGYPLREIEVVAAINGRGDENEGLFGRQ